MDKLQSVTPENSNNEDQRGSTNGVASLISALLDNVTESKATESKAAESIATESKVTELKVTEAQVLSQQSNAAEQPSSITGQQAANAPFPQDHSRLSSTHGEAVAPISAAVHPEFSPISNVFHQPLTLPNGNKSPANAEERLAPITPVGKNAATEKVETEVAATEIAETEVAATEIAETEKASDFLQPARSATVESTTITQTAGTNTESESVNASSAEQPPSTELYQSDGMAINIKGRADGVMIEIGRGSWEILVEALRRRLEQAGGFFRGGNVALDLADRSLQESDLRLICDVLVGHNMKPALVHTSSDRTFQSALMLGLAGTLESMDGRPLETVQAASSNQESQTHYVYRGALRSGQVLKRRSHVLIIGDVNPGSEVIATGDILIWGRLRGTVHAGVEGDKRAIVAAFDIDPVQLKIADAVAIGNSSQSEGSYRWVWSRNSEKRPEVARLINGQIAIEPWDEAKTGGSPVLKKRR